MDLTQKARYVKGGNILDLPSSMTYVIVVGRDIVRIAFLVAVLNHLDILARYIHNSKLDDDTKEKIFLCARDKCKSDQDKVVVIVRGIYGLTPSALDLHNHLAELLGNFMGFKSSITNPGIWFKESMEKDGSQYYTYSLVFDGGIIIVDNIVASSCLY